MTDNEKLLIAAIVLYLIWQLKTANSPGLAGPADDPFLGAPFGGALTTPGPILYYDR